MQPDAKVMLVDDEPMITEVVQTYLEEGGYTNVVTMNEPASRARAHPRGTAAISCSSIS